MLPPQVMESRWAHSLGLSNKQLDDALAAVSTWMQANRQSLTSGAFATATGLGGHQRRPQTLATPSTASSPPAPRTLRFFLSGYRVRRTSAAIAGAGRRAAEFWLAFGVRQ